MMHEHYGGNRDTNCDRTAVATRALTGTRVVTGTRPQGDPALRSIRASDAPTQAGQRAGASPNAATRPSARAGEQHDQCEHAGDRGEHRQHGDQSGIRHPIGPT